MDKLARCPLRNGSERAQVLVSDAVLGGDRPVWTVQKATAWVSYQKQTPYSGHKGAAWEWELCPCRRFEEPRSFLLFKMKQKAPCRGMKRFLK